MVPERLQNMNRRHLLALSITAAVLVTGCTTNILPPVDSYTIGISCRIEAPSGEKPGSPRVLKVAIPESVAAINSHNILYQEGEFAQNPYAHSRWSDTPNKMLDGLLRACVNKSSIFKAVLPSYSKGHGDLLLESRLSEFYHHINADGGSEGRVRIEFYLIRAKSGHVVATHEFSSNISATTLDAKGGVRAINEASRSVALDMVQWLSSLPADESVEN